MIAAAIKRLDPMFAVALSVGIAAAALFLVWPTLDTATTAFFYRGSAGFKMSEEEPYRSFSKYLRWIVAAIAAGLLANLARTWWGRAKSELPLRATVFLLAVLAVGPGIVANAVFKDNWGRPRPSHTTEFGGQKTFTPPLVVSDQCTRNCSFVSGDASVGFAFVALAFVFPRRRGAAICLGLSLGTAAGAMRIAQGGHYLSDVVFAGVFMCMTVASLAALLRPVREGAPGKSDDGATAVVAPTTASARGTA